MAERDVEIHASLDARAFGAGHHADAGRAAEPRALSHDLIAALAFGLRDGRRAAGSQGEQGGHGGASQ
jgi:hypothetical protein